MNHQRFRVSHIRQVAGQFQLINEFRCIFFFTPHTKIQYASKTILQIFFCQRIIRTGRKSGVFYKFNLRMIFQPPGKFQSIVNMTLNAQGKCFKTLC